jgi:hypothetical protein
MIEVMNFLGISNLAKRSYNPEWREYLLVDFLVLCIMIRYYIMINTTLTLSSLIVMPH